MSLLIWFLLAFGFCYTVGHARVSLGVRTWMSGFPRLTWFLLLIECPACLGFWVGLVGGLLLPMLPPAPFQGWLAAPALGFATCAVGYILGRATGWIQEE